MLPFGLFVLYRFWQINDIPSLFVNSQDSPDLYEWEFMQWVIPLVHNNKVIPCSFLLLSLTFMYYYT